VFIVLTACNNIKNADYGKLTLPGDTLLFDTIFTYVGSTTKILEVYNNTNKAIKLNKIFLAGGNSSKFRLNIDGKASNEEENVIIDAKDSLFIFVEITINPQTDPLLEDDSIIFLSGKYKQKIILQAVGQDVHFFNGQIIKTQTWTDDKPYLIYNSILVDTGQTLTIEPGVKIYSHRNSYIYVKGKIIANGTKDEKIKFSGDRIDNNFYKNKPGQWGGIVFLPQSYGNYLNYIDLTEGFYGIAVDSMLSDQTPTLVIDNSSIEHCSYIGLYATRTYVKVFNSIIADCGVHNIGLLMYGKYEFFHCTIENDYSYSVRNSPAVGIQNFYKYNGQIIRGDNIQAYFFNSIIYGNMQNEFLVSAFAPNTIDYSVVNCLMKINLKLNDTTKNNFMNIIANKSPQYVSLAHFDYHLTKQSPAINKANAKIDKQNLSFLQFDMDKIDRLSDSKPDIGALEYTNK
jgi:hypothetical protein